VGEPDEEGDGVSSGDGVNRGEVEGEGVALGVVLGVGEGMPVRSHPDALNRNWPICDDVHGWVGLTFTMRLCIAIGIEVLGAMLPLM
jgi:hypothetical protein